MRVDLHLKENDRAEKRTESADSAVPEFRISENGLGRVVPVASNGMGATTQW